MSCTLRLNYYCARRDPVICLSTRAGKYVWNSVDVVSLSQGRVRLRLDWYATHAADYLGCRGKTNNSRAARVGESESTLPTMCTVHWMGVKTDLATGLLMIVMNSLWRRGWPSEFDAGWTSQIKHLVHGSGHSKLVVGTRACPIDSRPSFSRARRPGRAFLQQCSSAAVQQQCKSRACRWPWH